MALFPDNHWDHRGNITSYMAVGQHGGASQDWMLEPAIFDEDLFLELISIGYDDLEVDGPFSLLVTQALIGNDYEQI